MINKIKFHILRRRLKACKVKGLIDRHEAFFLYQVALNATGGEIVEIGSHYGYSTICLASSGKRVHAIDPHYGNPEHQVAGQTFNSFDQFKKNIEQFNLSKNVNPMVMTSEQASQGWNRPVSLLWIDANHDYEFVKKDYDLWTPFLISNGILAFHDAAPTKGWPGPQRLVQELSQTNAYKPFQYVNGIAWTNKL